MYCTAGTADLLGIMLPDAAHLQEAEDSKRLNDMKGPGIIIAGSGMATGGRILHHLKRHLPDPRSPVLFVGYQAEGTRGRLLKDGAREVKMLGVTVPVRARVRATDAYSAHADGRGILRVAGRVSPAPRHDVHRARRARGRHRAWPGHWLGARMEGRRGRRRPARGALSVEAGPSENTRSRGLLCGAGAPAPLAPWGAGTPATARAPELTGRASPMRTWGFARVAWWYRAC